MGLYSVYTSAIKTVPSGCTVNTSSEVPGIIPFPLKEESSVPVWATENWEENDKTNKKIKKK
jgi:hypothetical protein